MTKKRLIEEDTKSALVLHAFPIKKQRLPPPDEIREMFNKNLVAVQLLHNASKTSGKKYISSIEKTYVDTQYIQDFSNEFLSGIGISASSIKSWREYIEKYETAQADKCETSEHDKSRRQRFTTY